MFDVQGSDDLASFGDKGVGIFDNPIPSRVSCFKYTMIPRQPPLSLNKTTIYFLTPPLTFVTGIEDESLWLQDLVLVGNCSLSLAHICEDP